MATDDDWEYVAETLSVLKEQMDIYDAAVDGMMIAPESPLIDPVSRVFDVALDVLEALIGDGFGNLHYWVYECEYGENPMEVTVDGEERMMKTLDDIRWAIEA